MVKEEGIVNVFKKIKHGTVTRMLQVNQSVVTIFTIKFRGSWDAYEFRKNNIAILPVAGFLQSEFLKDGREYCTD